jgi:hypothetical protein
MHVLLLGYRPALKKEFEFCFLKGKNVIIKI